MLGRFLEISVSCTDVLETLHAFTEIGFREIPVGDVWTHPYAVVSDGTLNIGLHRYDFDSPSLTFVQQNLDQWIAGYRALGIELAFEKLSSESFNELGFVDPSGQMTAVLESRTFSPPPFEDRDVSMFGRFNALEIPTDDPETSLEFWTKVGLEEDGRLGTAQLALRFGQATSLVCHFDGDVMAVAEQAARRGLTSVKIAGDERSARMHIAGLTLMTHQSA
ncbi:MAG: hypothetical protein AB8G17_05430 [Gammaproteobacteria bacterium]